MANVVKKQEEKKQTGVNMISKIMGLFALLVLCVFPVVYHNYYFDILQTKYHSYCVMATGMMAVMFMYGMYTNKAIESLKSFRLSKWVKSLNVVDWFVLLFWFATVMSWVFCDWRWEAFWGTSGRFNGVFLISIYTVVYFMVTRFCVLKRSYLDAFLIVSLFVCLFGITDYFQMDLLGFKEMMLEDQKSKYTSTFGNINTYTVYVGAVICVSMVLYVMETCKKRSAFYFVTMAISMVAIIVGTSDNAYLMLAALFGFSPLCFFRKRTWLRRYLASIAVFFSAVLFVGWINVTYADIVFGLDSIFVILTSLSILPVAVAGLWGIVIGWSVLAAKKGEKDELGKGFALFWIGVIVAVVAVVGYVLYDANLAGNAEKYDAIKNYVVFNDNWGTNRGYVWIRSVRMFNTKLEPIQKLFGYGADTFKLIMMQNYSPRENTVFDSVHNEYLHFLITIGLTGMAAYIGLFASAVVKMIKRMKNRPEVTAILFVVLAYATQATVNIFLPVVFPLIWQMLAMGLCKTPEEIENNH